MEKQTHRFSTKTVDYYFDASLADLNKITDRKRCILIIDEKVAQLHGHKLPDWRKITVTGEEASKSLSCFQHVVEELIRFEADRQTILIGIGGGVITDLTGFVAGVYMRGVPFGFVPSTLLAQVDAAIGGKNGLNFGAYKNLLGQIQQPDFLLFDYDLLDTLELPDFTNGFAEIIKYGCIYDSDLFSYLANNSTLAGQRDRQVINHLVKQSVAIKTEIVQQDPFENGQRRILNFGHTIGHAVEKLEKIPHGQAVAKGMVIAAEFSVELAGFPVRDLNRLIQLITACQLPVVIDSQAKSIENLFKMDKKREGNAIHFILLSQLGKSVIHPINLTELAALLENKLAAR